MIQCAVVRRLGCGQRGLASVRDQDGACGGHSLSGFSSGKEGVMRTWKDGPTVQGGRRIFLKLLTGAGVAGALGLVPKPAAAQTTPGAAGSPRTSPALT